MHDPLSSASTMLACLMLGSVHMDGAGWWLTLVTRVVPRTPIVRQGYNNTV